MGNAGKPATVEDVDERDEPLPDTTRKASTKDKTSKDKSTKEKSKGARESRPHKEKRSSRSDSGYSSQTPLTESTASSPLSPRAEIVRESPSTRDRESRARSSSTSGTKSPRKTSRPPSSRRSRDVPPIDTNLSASTRSETQYAAQPLDSGPVLTHATLASRPKAGHPPAPSIRQRPQSFYGGPTPAHDGRPPLSKSAYSNVPTPPNYPQTSNPYALPPPPLPAGYMPTYSTTSALSAESYFTTPSPQTTANLANLKQRFQRSDPVMRSATAVPRSAGVRPATSQYEQPVYALDQRQSIHISQEEQDRIMMPPPSADYRRPTSRRSPTTYSRRGDYAFDDEDFVDDVAYDVLPERHDYVQTIPAAPRPSIGRYPTYDMSGPKDRLEIAGSRRNSYYEPSSVRSGGTSWEDKAGMATKYQNETCGGPSRDLTAAALLERSRTTAGSRSTRSSKARDDSDYRRAGTARTVRSEAQDSEAVTIRLAGQGTVRIGDAEINYRDGGEVIVGARQSIRMGSERSSTEYSVPLVEDRRSRDGRSTTSSRPPSRSRRSSSSRPQPAYVEREWF